MKPELVAILVFKVGMTLFQIDNLSEGSGPLDVCSFTSYVQGEPQSLPPVLPAP